MIKIKGNPDCVRGKSAFRTDWPKSCCTETKPCAIGQGDCEKDIDCLGNLICKEDSCPGTRVLRDCCQKGASSLKKDHSLTINTLVMINPILSSNL